LARDRARRALVARDLERAGGAPLQVKRKT